MHRLVMMHMSQSHSSGATSSVMSVEPPVVLPPPLLPVEAPPVVTLGTMDEWYARIPAADRVPGAVYSLSNAPLGMRVNQATGYMRWTPDETQVGSFAVTVLRDASPIMTINFSVTFSQPSPPGIYVAPNGSGNAAGTLADPFNDIQKASKLLGPGQSLYIRGGLYRNSDWGTPFVGRTKSNLAFLSDMVGAEGQPITIRPFGNEHVTLESDVSAFAFKRSRWVNVEGIEFRGTIDQIDYEKAVALWWVLDERLNETGGTAISFNECFHMNVRRCVIVGYSGGGITNNYGEYIFVDDSVLAHNARWAVGGVHAWSNSKPGSGLQENVGDIKIAARRNLIVDAQQCIPSRVPAKGFADLILDEGGGLHTQAQSTVTPDGGVVFGQWHVTDNLVMYCGKSGINQNQTGHLTIARNSLFENVQNTTSANIHLKPPEAGDASFDGAVASVYGNIIHGLPGTQSINKIGSGDKYTGIGQNYITPGGHQSDADYVANTQVEEAAQVFADPANGNWKRHSSIPAGFGVNDDVIDSLMHMVDEYGIDLSPCPVDTNAVVDPVTGETYMDRLIQRIFDDWPDPASLPADFGPNFELHVGGYHYTYAQRASYPGPPA